MESTAIYAIVTHIIYNNKGIWYSIVEWVIYDDKPNKCIVVVRYGDERESEYWRCEQRYNRMQSKWTDMKEDMGNNMQRN